MNREDRVVKEIELELELGHYTRMDGLLSVYCVAYGTAFGRDPGGLAFGSF